MLRALGSRVFCACWLYPGSTARTQPWSAELLCKHRAVCPTDAWRGWWEHNFFHVNFLLWKSWIQTVNVTFLGLSRAAATSHVLGIDMLNQLFHLINHIQTLIWLKIRFLECHRLIFDYVLFCIKQNESRQALVAFAVWGILLQKPHIIQICHSRIFFIFLTCMSFFNQLCSL